jgi:hypothetical protein
VDAISPAFEHTKRQLFQPFRIGQWVRLALVGLLAGELSSGGFKIPNLSNFNLPRHPGSEHFLTSDLAGSAPMLFAGLIAVLVVAALLLGILLTYVSSVMRFILFDSVLVKDCHIREGWSRRQGPGWHYFLWKLLYLLSTFGVLIVLVGIPAGFAFAVGWLNNPKQHMVVLVLGGIALFLAIMIFLFVMAVIYVLTKDFVVPQMALENIGDRAGDSGGDHSRHRRFHYWAHHFDPSRGSCGRRRARRESGRAGLDSGHDHAGGGGRVRAAGCFSFCDGPDFRARHRILSRVLHIFLRGALSGPELCAPPRTASVSSVQSSPVARRAHRIDRSRRSRRRSGH